MQFLLFSKKKKTVRANWSEPPKSTLTGTHIIMSQFYTPAFSSKGYTYIQVYSALYSMLSAQIYI